LQLRNFRLFLVLLILLVGVFARLWMFGAAPSGLQHDELFKAQEGKDLIENGDFRLFYASNQGHEGGYVWLLGLSYALFGANTVMVRIPAFWCGVLTLALLYRFAKDTLGFRVALLAAGLAAGSFWLVSVNRVGLRANLLPLVALAVLWGLWRITNANKARWGWALVTGVLLGLAVYTYTASLALYLALPVFLLGLALADFARFKKHLPLLVLVLVLGAGLALPMLHLRLADPQGRNRVSTINAPWEQFKAGDPALLLENARLLGGMPAFSGDPEWRYNVAGRPLFWLPIGLLVYSGLGVLLWRSRRQPILLMLLGLTLFGLIPSLLTTSAPSYLRSISAAPGVLLGIAVSIDALGHGGRYSRVVWGVGVLVVAITAGRDFYAYWGEWVKHPEVRTIYRDDLKQLARTLQEQGEDLVLVSTDEPIILDPAIYGFSNRPRQVDVLWFDGGTNIALSEQPRLLFVSRLAPISPAHQYWLSTDYGTQALPPLLDSNGDPAFSVYRLATDGGAALRQHLAQVGTWQVLADAELLALPINLGDQLQLVGVQMPQRVIPAKDNGVDDGLQLQLYLRPLVADSGEPLSLFVHFVSSDDRTVFGRDFLGAPPTSWNTEVVFIQDNYIGSYTVEPGRYRVALGLYNTLTGERHPIFDADGNALGDRIFLGQIDALP